MSKWIEKELGELYSYEQPYKYIVENTDYDKKSGIPVLTAGKSFILGYTKETDGVYSNLPVIIFDDFTTECKYVDFPFKVKSSAMKFLKAKNDKSYFLPLLFAYLETLKLFEVGEHKRQWLSEYTHKIVYLPEDIEEQKRIAAILSKADELIEATQTLIDKQKKVKTGLMQTLLTCGIDDKGVIRSPKTHKFKDSELGPIPEEWQCVELGKILERGKGSMQTGPFGSSLHSNEYVDEGCSVIMPQDILHNEINWIEISHITEDKKTTLKRHIVNEHDVLFARRGDLSKCAVIMSHCDAICGTGCLLLRPNKAELNSLWLKNVYQQTKIQDQVTSMSVGTTMLNINAKILKSLVLAFPSLNEQNRIVSVLQQQDQIIKDLENEKQKYIDIKKGLMADLLTGKVKVSS